MIQVKFVGVLRNIPFNLSPKQLLHNLKGNPSWYHTLDSQVWLRTKFLKRKNSMRA